MHGGVDAVVLLDVELGEGVCLVGRGLHDVAHGRGVDDVAGVSGVSGVDRGEGKRGWGVGREG